VGAGSSARVTLTVGNTQVRNNDNGGLIVSAGTATVSNSTLAGNYGSGLSNQGTLTASGLTISANVGWSGGGVISPMPGAGIYNTGSLTLVNSTVSGNSGASGAGIYLETPAKRRSPT